MGYSVYWEFLDWHGEWRQTWPQLIEEAKLIIEAADILVCGPTPEEFPRHYFNTLTDQDIDFYPPVCEVEDGIWLNGLAEDGHEAFVLRRSHRHDSCKTLLKPYDTIVGCILLCAYQLQPDLTIICSDGNWEESWSDIRKLYSELWPGRELFRPPDLHGVEERPSDPRHPRAWLNTISTDVCATNKDTLPVQVCPRDETNPTLPSFALDPRKAGHIKEWLSCCDTNPEHKSCRPLPFSWSPLPGIFFRLIDLK